MSIVKLRRPFIYKGTEYREIELNLEGLTGADIVKVESELTAQGKIVVSGDFSKIYLSRIAAKAAKLPVEELEKLDVRDFTRITNEVQAFLLEPDSSDESEEQPEEAALTELQPASSAESS
jgi:hypothetical protein